MGTAAEHLQGDSMRVRAGTTRRHTRIAIIGLLAISVRAAGCGGAKDGSEGGSNKRLASGGPFTPPPMSGVRSYTGSRKYLLELLFPKETQCALLVDFVLDRFFGRSFSSKESHS